MRINGVLMTVLIALGTVVAYDKYGKQAAGIRRGA